MQIVKFYMYSAVYIGCMMKLFQLADNSCTNLCVTSESVDWLVPEASIRYMQYKEE